MKSPLLCIAALVLSGCAYPTSSIEQGSEQGHLSFSDIPVGAQISIDGRLIATRTDSRALVFNVPSGKHVVEEISSGQILFHREYDVGAGSTLDVRTQN